jgi:EmrB/QacA subfamily drug resistance transporter
VSSPPPALRLDSASGRWVVTATVLGSAVATIDSTVVGIALPAIGRDLHMSVATLQWVVGAYLLSLAGLLLVGGAMGDRYGRRRVFVIGVVLFACTSLVCAAAPDGAVLITGRALQGAAAALLTPGSLAILRTSFAQDDQGRAVGAWSGLGGVATAVGPFLGGFLISAVSWRLIFFINVPVAVAVVLISTRHVPETVDPGAQGRLDVVGSLLVTAGLVGITSAVIEAPSQGWASGSVLGSLLGGAAAMAVFLAVERRQRDPVLPLAIFRSVQFSATNLVTFLVYAALGGALFLLPIQLEQVSHYSPLAAGTSLLPLTAVMLALSARSGALASRIGPRLQMGVGPVVVGAGMVLLRVVGETGNYVTEVLPAVLVLGIGLTVTVAPLTATAMSSAPGEHAGVASAVNNDVARAGSLIAVALLPGLAGITGAAYLHPLAFSAGFRNAVLIAGVASVVGGAVGGLLIRNPGAVTKGEHQATHCGLDSPPLVSATVGTTPAAGGARMTG